MKESSNTSSDDFYDEALNLNSLDCKAAFMSINVPEPRGPILIFGEQFMKKFYTVFDRDEKVMGFSIANQNNLKSDKGSMDISKGIRTPYDVNGNEEENESLINEKDSNSISNRKVNGFRFENFLEEKIDSKISQTSKITFRDRNPFRNNNNNDKSKQRKDDLFFIHP